MNSKKIVIVDDDVAILDSLGTMLDFEGFEVNTFMRGSEIFRLIETENKPNLILLDMWLCGEDGRDICKQLKSNERTKNIPVIIMSASRGLENTALQSGANAFIAKPFEIDDVVNKLHQLIA
ncbi:MAG TPA: response regulator [Kaistella chaponensis]|mgnify:FL=1|jgi:DNA-binding response OmpR family regulator|uniref:Two-component system, OmpR family, alkaline phosphatase synthesis response regulator PhoP n=1 Tax=Kaistella chaponensis TaxID=713588 RepID=A0A1N7MWK8_9FLAO|nr:response regulator [Kaistella chaponensis]SIS90321.1 two-component system, OmpR family, alkaline phosphatase synthesis response regulator PhoP [Kaistella chaponensis]HPW87841.1 response regulator [Kaistella chaponensis]HQC06430.1 response regulator [Kaistella chaponensis]